MPANNRETDQTPNRFYRPDIDGLRAIAVCLVIAHHIGFNHFSGGFIGVDIFFVISGYLISSILLRDLDANRFSIAAFYERRIRRILPALLAVLAITTAIGWRYFFPIDMIDYARSLIATVLSFSNVYFGRQSGYFDFSSTRRPLLHTWSLGVEEQFYIVFPVLLLILHRYARRRLPQIVLLIAAISFLASAILVFRYPTETFYLAPARAWELMIGTVLVLGIVKLPDSKWQRNAAGLLGLGLLLAATILMNPSTPFPGATALFPCIGSALIIMTGERKDTFVSRLLSLRPIVFLGLISYSLYLWHWPLLALRNYGFKESIDLAPRVVRLLLLVEILILGTLSWRFIETPFRKGRLPRRDLFVRTAGVLALVVVLSSFAVGTHGLPARYSAEVLAVSSFALYGGDPVMYREGQCFLTETHPLGFDKAACLPEIPSGTLYKPTFVLAGSSHAAHLWLGLSTVFRNFNVQQATASNCPPTIEQSSNAPFFCRDLYHFLFKEYLPAHKVAGVILSSRWDSNDLVALGHTLDYLDSLNIKAYVVGPIAEYDMPLPQVLASAILTGKSAQRDIASHLSPLPFEADGPIGSLVGSHRNATYISLVSLLCPEHSCIVYAAPGIPLQADWGHLTREGSIKLAQRIRDAGVFHDAQ